MSSPFKWILCNAGASPLLCQPSTLLLSALGDFLCVEGVGSRNIMLRAYDPGLCVPLFHFFLGLP